MIPDLRFFAEDAPPVYPWTDIDGQRHLSDEPVSVVHLCSGDMDGYNPLPRYFEPEEIVRITCYDCGRRRIIQEQDEFRRRVCGECAEVGFEGETHRVYCDPGHHWILRANGLPDHRWEGEFTCRRHQRPAEDDA